MYGVVNNWANLNVEGTITPDAIVTGSIDATSISGPVVASSLVVPSDPPAAADSTGVAGTVTWDADYIYVCVATDTWVRAALATWA